MGDIGERRSFRTEVAQQRDGRVGLSRHIGICVFCHVELAKDTCSNESWPIGSVDWLFIQLVVESRLSECSFFCFLRSSA